MKVFWSEKHVLHTPKWYVADGAVRECPDVAGRVEGILAAVRGVKGMEVCEARNVDVMGAVGRVHDSEYLEYLRTIHAEWVKEFGGDVLPDTFVRREGMRRPAKPSAQVGWYCFDMAAPITQGTWEAAVESARLAVSAAEVVAAGERGAYALCRPPGHHAGRDYCGGFCYLNNAAIAAEHLRAAGMGRVAIVDVDYHHGNGTQDIFYQRQDVLFVSIHADPNTQYPYFWGYAEERGSGKGEGFNLNLPLRRGATSAEWFGALEVALKRLKEYGAEGVVVSLGVDTHEADGVGDFRLATRDFLEVGRRIGTLGLPTVFVQEGGYNLETVGECVAAVLAGFSD